MEQSLRREGQEVAVREDHYQVDYDRRCSRCKRLFVGLTASQSKEDVPLSIPSLNVIVLRK